jgi:hypothetical protein
MKLGALDISTVKLGANQVQAVYQGSNLVWQNAPVAIAATGVGQTSFTANWNAYSGATYYLLDVSESSDFSTFVYENQIVEAPNTSYVVIGLNSNTTYYYRVRASDEDPDAAAFFARVDAATLSTDFLTLTEKKAVNQMVLDMKAGGSPIWNQMQVIYPYVGGATGTLSQKQAALSQNLKSASFTGSFTATDITYSNKGFKGGQVLGFFNTNFNYNNCGLNSIHRSVYVQEEYTALGSNWCVTNGGSFIGSAGRNEFALNDNFSNISAANTNPGLEIIYRNNSSQSNRFRGNSLSTSSTSSSSLCNQNAFVGCYNNAGVAAAFTGYTFSFASMGDGLTDEQASSLNTLVQAFQTSLSRQV